MYIDDDDYDEDDDDYDEDDDDEADEEELIFEFDEPSPTKFNIVLCEHYNDKIHGTPNGVDIYSHYLVISIFKKLDTKYLNKMSSFYNSSYLKRKAKIVPHKIIRNYPNIISNPSYIKPEIAHCLLLPGGEQICILKTFWIRLIQRTWKKIYRIRKETILKRSNVNSLLYRQVNGKWPNNCKYLPPYKGMLCKN
jgi:hypothetical protein